MILFFSINTQYKLIIGQYVVKSWQLMVSFENQIDLSL
jgi:hypothetical protein